jgi:hypothetical protein
MVVCLSLSPCLRERSKGQLLKGGIAISKSAILKIEILKNAI